MKELDFYKLDPISDAQFSSSKYQRQNKKVKVKVAHTLLPSHVNTKKAKTAYTGTRLPSLGFRS